MTIRIAIGVLLSAVLAISAHAQSFDGAYKGTRKITRDLAYTPANLAWGAAFPALGGEIYFSLRKPT